ncbi:MAG: right-handed parallel beta-helix repeat-containing protein, partial [Candidatus Symbiothrix sp.]|nr:right-handed parallel beta-helix repeat-containing protein [Candidatus Symbiothrix sp.]
MKFNYLSGMISILFFSLSITSSYAEKNVYLSVTGDDTHDGLTLATSVASITRAFTLLADGDTIRVSGMIDLTQTPGFLTDGNSFTVPAATMGWNQGFAIIGDDKATAGFDGKKQGRFGNQIAGYEAATAVISFKNLTFKDCGKNALGGGSVLRVVNNGGQIFVDNCHFTGSVGTQGSILAYNSNLNVTNCRFYENTVQLGGAIFFNGISTRPVLVENCIIENNNPGDNSHGGAFYLTDNSSDVTIRNCIIRNNIITGYGGAVHINAGTARTKETSVTSKVTIENTLITANESSSHCPGIYINNSGAFFPVQLTLINSTVYKNESAGMGTIWIYDAVAGSELNLVNSTIVENHSRGNAGHGPGVRINENTGNPDRSAAKNMYKRIYNTIIERNMADETPGNSGDLWINSDPQTDGENLEVRNSYIGFAKWGSNPGSPYTTGQHGNSLGYNLAGGAELAWPSMDYIASRGCIPLDFESPALTGGDARYLQNRGINTDCEGYIRPFIDGKCAIGSVESPVVAGIIEGESHNYTHYIIYGQSLSTGHESDPLSTENVPGNYMLGDRVWINNGNATPNNLNPLVATTTAGPQAETPLLGTVNHLRNKIPLVTDENGKENRFLATSAGTSGKPIEELSKEYLGDDYLYGHYRAAIDKGKSMALRRSSTITCPAIIFMQGEWNYQGYGNNLAGTNNPLPTAKKDEYKALFTLLKENMLSDIVAKYEQENPPLFYTYQVGVQYSKGTTLEIGMAQLEAANENNDIIMIGPVYPMSDVGGHLDANGYRWYGEMIGKVIYKTQVLGENFSPLQPAKISRTAGNPKQIKIKYSVPKPPLAWDTNTLLKMPDYGFNLYVNDAKKTITDIRIEGDNTVVITSGSDLAGKLTITYAGTDATLSGYNLRGHGNLRDSDDYGAFFNYEQKTWVSTATSSGHPKDGEGNIIYGKPYPLYNFSVAFCYELPAGTDEYNIPNVPDGGTGFSGITIQDSYCLQQRGADLCLSVAGKCSVKLDIYTVSGNRVQSYAQEIVSAGTQKYSLSALPQGVYIAKARAGN